MGGGVRITRCRSSSPVPSAEEEFGKLLLLIGLTGGVTRDGALSSLELLVDHLDG
jgi:hypothetical protein